MSGRLAAAPAGTRATRLAGTPLWRYSLRLYGRPGVERACLWLQDRHGADVNLLLFCCWLASRGRSADRRLLARAAGAVSGWRREAVEPLRRVRRRLARGVPGVPPEWCEVPRARTRVAELEAERVEQTLLARLAARAPQGPAGRVGALAHLERYRELLGAPPRGETGRHLAVLAAAAGPQPGRSRRRRARAGGG